MYKVPVPCTNSQLLYTVLQKKSGTDTRSITYFVDSASWTEVGHWFWFERSFVRRSAEGPPHRGDMLLERQTAAAAAAATRRSRGKASSLSACGVPPRWSVRCLLSASEGPAAVEQPPSWGAGGPLGLTRQNLPSNPEDTVRDGIATYVLPCLDFSYTEWAIQ